MMKPLTFLPRHRFSEQLLYNKNPTKNMKTIGFVKSNSLVASIGVDVLYFTLRSALVCDGVKSSVKSLCMDSKSTIGAKMGAVKNKTIKNSIN